MRRQGAAVGAPLSRSLRARGRRLGFGLGRRLRLALLDVFECKQQLIVRQALGATAEAVALQILDDLNKPFSAISIAFSVSGSSGSVSAVCVMSPKAP